VPRPHRQQPLARKELQRSGLLPGLLPRRLLQPQSNGRRRCPGHPHAMRPPRLELALAAPVPRCHSLSL